MYKRLLLTLMALILSLGSAQAQVVTPSFDPTMSAESASAISRRDEGSVVGLITVTGTGTREFGAANSLVSNAALTNANVSTGDKLADIKLGVANKFATPSVIFSTTTDKFSFEAWLTSGLTQLAELDEGGKKASLLNDGHTALLATEATMTIVADGSTIEQETTLHRMHVYGSYNLSENLAIGIGYKQEKQPTTTTKSYSSTAVSTAAGVGVTLTDTELTNTDDMKTTGVTLNYRLGALHFVGGIESVTDQTTGDSTNNVQNSWQNTVFGVGFLSGKPGSTQFRAEYSQKSSSSSAEAASGSNSVNYHQKTVITRMSADVKVGDLVFAYLNKTEKFSELNVSGSTVATTEEKITTQYGGSFVPEKGLTFSLYAFSISNDDKGTDESTTDTKYSIDGLRIHVGLKF
ncbi:MAG: hypothetical protein ACI86H_000479 [bacterium]|jgi:hypothetical protein